MKNVMMFVLVSLFMISGNAFAGGDHDSNECGNHGNNCSGPAGPVGATGPMGPMGPMGLTGTVDTTLLESNMERLDGGVALAIASASHQYDVNHNGMQGSMSTGFYNGQMALSLGIGGKIDNNAFVNVNVSHSFKGTGVGAGLSVKF